jgi:hypothetical protein
VKEGKMSKTIITPLINGLTSTTIHPERVKQIASIQYDTDDLRNGHILKCMCGKWNIQSVITCPKTQVSV